MADFNAIDTLIEHPKYCDQKISSRKSRLFCNIQFCVHTHKSCGITASQYLSAPARLTISCNSDLFVSCHQQQMQD